MIKIVVAEDHSIVREGTKIILEQDKELEVVGLAENGLEAIEMCKKLEPHVVLMDLKMPKCDGIEATKSIKAYNPKIKVIMLTTFDGGDDVSNAFFSGADGYILKDVDPQELINAIKSVTRGFSVLQQTIFTAFLTTIPKRQSNTMQKAQSANLTSNELNIIQQVVYGKNNKEIASAVHLSEGRVKNIISEILAKLELKDRTQLAVYAMKNDLV